MTVNFEYPWLLLSLLALPGLAFYLCRSNQAGGLGFSNIALVASLPISQKHKYVWIIPALYLVALSFTVVALSQPYTSQTKVTNGSSGIAVALVVDVSTSMEFDMSIDSSQQAKQPRLDVAKQVLKQFVLGDEYARGRADDLISVITFARYADTLVPLTKSHKALISMTDEITTSSRLNEDGTAFGDATALAAAQLNQYENNLGLEHDSIKNKIIILLTDGENNSGAYEPMMAAAMAAKWGIKVYTISLSDDHSTMSLPTTSDMINNDWLLQQMASATGGVFQRADSLKALQQIYQTIDKLETSELLEVSFQQNQPVFHLPVIIALICLALIQVLQASWLRQLV